MKNTLLFVTLLGMMATLGLMSFEKDSAESQKQYIEDMVAENADIFRAEKEAECQELALQQAILEADEVMLTAKTAAPKPRKPQTTKPASPRPKPTPKPTTTTTYTTPSDTYTPPSTTTYTPPATTTYTPPTTTTTTVTTPATTTTITTPTVTQPSRPSLGKGEAAPDKTTTTTTTTSGTTTTTAPKKPRLGKGKKRDNN